MRFLANYLAIFVQSSEHNVCITCSVKFCYNFLFLLLQLFDRMMFRNKERRPAESWLFFQHFHNQLYFVLLTPQSINIPNNVIGYHG